MPKYDPFGREIGEDTLAGLGGTESSQEQPVPAEEWTEAQFAEAASFEPVTEPEPAAEPAFAAETPAAAPQPTQMPAFEIPTAPPASTVRVRRRGGAGCLVMLIVLAVIAAVPILVIVSIVGSAGDAIDEITDVIESAPDVEIPAVPEQPVGPAKPPAGIAGRSMVAPGNFGRALARLRGMGGVAAIRLSPDRVAAQLVKGSRQRGAVVDFEGELTRGAAAGGVPGLGTVPLSAIDRMAPARLVRGSAARYSVRPKGIDYLILSPWPGEGQRWVAYFKNGVYVQGDRNGRVVRRIS